MASEPLLLAVSSSARQLLLLLRCISFAKKAQVRIMPEGIRFSTAEGSSMEAVVFLEHTLFTTYTYRAPPPPVSPQHDASTPPIFEISLPALIETLNIFSLSDASTFKRHGDPDSFASHRLHRHAGLHAFSHQAPGMTGVCTLTYAGDGSPLSVHMAEAGVTTTCDLTTYDTDTTEDIPFHRDAVALRAILRSSALLDAITELAALNPPALTIAASTPPAPPAMRLAAAGPWGSAAIDFVPADDATTPSEHQPVLQTLESRAHDDDGGDGNGARASFRFALVRHAQRAMAAAVKVSVRLDAQGVLSLQFMIPVEAAAGGGGSGGSGSDGVTFVDFTVVPLVDGEAGGEGESDEMGGE